jgi:Effector protein
VTLGGVIAAMKKFESYPIYINHPGRWEEVRRWQRDYFVDKGDYKMMNWLDDTGKRLYEVTEDKTPGRESRDYEDQVYSLLRLIASTQAGRLLLGSFNRKVNHWIVPLDYLDKQTCQGCSAFTFPGGPKEGGGVRVYFSPNDFKSSAANKNWMTAADVLFHELVHAYQMGQVGYNPSPKSMNDYTSVDEFFALHMQNVYLADRGSGRFYRDYRTLLHVSKDTAYQYFANDAEVLMAFRYFVETDCLANKVAQWRHPANSFNPWRDQAVLERIYLNDGELQGVQRLPAFYTPGDLEQQRKNLRPVK